MKIAVKKLALLNNFNLFSVKKMEFQDPPTVLLLLNTISGLSDADSCVFLFSKDHMKITCSNKMNEKNVKRAAPKL